MTVGARLLSESCAGGSKSEGGDDRESLGARLTELRAADQLARLASELRFTALLVGVPDDDPIRFVPASARTSRRGLVG